MIFAIRVIRFFLSLVIIGFSSIILIRNSSYIFEDAPSYVVINGWGSTWAMVSLFFIGWLALAMTIASKGNWQTSKFNRVYVLSGIMSCIVISPIASTFFMYSLHEKAEGFVECNELRRASRLYSSKTYAITPLTCQRLVDDKHER
jgi:hypothetical protein